MGMRIGMIVLNALAKEEKMEMDIPKDKTYLPGDAQCSNCGGYGCNKCGYRGWVPPRSVYARKCLNPPCQNLIPPNQVAVYCSNQCAYDDAQ